MNRETKLTTLGRTDPDWVNPAVVRGSTVIFKTLADVEQSLDVDVKDGPFTYGLISTPTERALEEALAEIDSAVGAVVLGSGLAAITVTLLGLLRAGDHLLMTDACYGPSRIFCDEVLGKYGVDVEYYDPLVTDIEAHFKTTTRVVFMESPGSRTFEMQDVPAIATACRARGITSVVDNSWATPLGFRPLEHGVDLVVHALSKYIAGHADVMLGAVTARNRDLWETIKRTAVDLGHGCSPDDAWLGLRGLRSLAARLDRHEASARQIAAWLEAREEVERVLYPALPSDPGHAIFTRDFDRATGVFGIVLHETDRDRIAAMVESFDHFKLGYSWGGFESLLIPLHPERGIRTASSREEIGTVLRLSIGLEAPEDLIADLKGGFERLTRVR
jgi:cystathionine beta-lyase